MVPIFTVDVPVSGKRYTEDPLKHRRLHQGLYVTGRLFMNKLTGGTFIIYFSKFHHRMRCPILPSTNLCLLTNIFTVVKRREMR